MDDPRPAGTAGLTARPLVTVVMPVLDEVRHVARALESVQAQTYPAELLEIVVADGGSTDGTRDVVRERASTDPRIRLIDNPARLQSAGLNRAVASARGEVVARLDGHAAFPPEHLERCVALLRRTGAANVGGTMRVVATDPFGRAVAAATTSGFGTGGAHYRAGTTERDVDTVWLGCFRRDALVAVGGYDERLRVNEDYELNQRLRRAGYRVVFSPDMPVDYWPRTTIAAVALQYFRYGRGKAEAARRDRAVMRPRHLAAPAGMLAATALLGFALRGRGRPLTACAVAYGAAASGAAAVANRSEPWRVRALTAALFPVLHASWGTGFWAGALTRRGALETEQPVDRRRAC